MKKLAFVLLFVLLASLAAPVLSAFFASTWYVTTSGSDSHGCTNATTDACLSFARAYAVASAGDNVSIAAGTYVAQSVNGTKGGAVVTFNGASGSSQSAPCIVSNAQTTCTWGVIVASLAITGTNLDFENIAAKYDSTSLAPGEIDVGNFSATTYTTSNITIGNSSAQTMFLVAVNGLTFNGGSYGNYDPCQSSSTNEDGIDIYVVSGGQVSTENVTFNGIVMHDVTDHGNTCSGLPGTGRHVDCIQALAGHYITIENSIFFNCPTDNFIMRPYLDTLDNITVVNNWFGNVMNAGNGELMGGSSDTVGGTNTYAFNTSLGPGPNGGVGTYNVYGNIIPEYACVSTFTYVSNVFWTGVGCGSPKVTGFSTSNLTYVPTPSFQSGNVPIFSLVSNSTSAHAAGGTTLVPSTDIFGTTRPSPADAGAWQYPSGSHYTYSAVDFTLVFDAATGVHIVPVSHRPTAVTLTIH